MHQTLEPGYLNLPIQPRVLNAPRLRFRPFTRVSPRDQLPRPDPKPPIPIASPAAGILTVEFGTSRLAHPHYLPAKCRAESVSCSSFVDEARTRITSSTFNFILLQRMLSSAAATTALMLGPFGRCPATHCERAHTRLAPPVASTY